MKEIEQYRNYLAEKMDEWERERYEESERELDERYRGWKEVTEARRRFLAEKSNCP